MGLEEHLLTMFRDDFEFHDSGKVLVIMQHIVPTPKSELIPEAVQKVI